KARPHDGLRVFGRVAEDLLVYRWERLPCLLVDDDREEAWRVPKINDRVRGAPELVLRDIGDIGCSHIDGSASQLSIDRNGRTRTRGAAADLHKISNVIVGSPDEGSGNSCRIGGEDAPG